MELLLFGIARDIVGEPSLDLSNREIFPKSVAQLKGLLTSEYPEFSSLSSFAVAVNSEYADDEVPLDKGDEIAIIPPVSGG